MYLDAKKYIFEILLSNGRSVEVPTQKEWERWPSGERRLLDRERYTIGSSANPASQLATR